MVSDEVRQKIIERARLRCECEGKKCKHHRPGDRCKKGLRGREWVAHRRVQSAGDKLWNLVGWCATCAQNNRK